MSMNEADTGFEAKTSSSDGDTVEETQRDSDQSRNDGDDRRDRLTAPVAALQSLVRPARGTDYARSNRSRFITLVQAATKSLTNFSLPSALA